MSLDPSCKLPEPQPRFRHAVTIANAHVERDYWRTRSFPLLRRSCGRGFLG
jgi:hypothetical protein